MSGDLPQWDIFYIFDGMNTSQLPPFVISVGRQFGSGGRELAKALATELGIDYYDKELLVKASSHSGISCEFFEKTDEKFPSFLQGLFSFTMGVTPMCYYTGTGAITDDSLYKAVSDFLRSASSAINPPIKPPAPTISTLLLMTRRSVEWRKCRPV